MLGGRVAERVGEQIVDHLTQAVRVAYEGYRFSVEAELYARGLLARGEGDDRVAGDLGEVARRTGERELVGVDPR